MHVAKEWGVPPDSIFDWSDRAYGLAIAYLNRLKEMDDEARLQPPQE